MTPRLDPLAASEHIARTYKRYLGSVTSFSDEGVKRALGEALDSESLIRGPFLEATPAYKPGSSLRQMIREGILPATFAEFDGLALPVDRPLYAHQERALRKARSGRNIVVATGTGSGKTESFLVPILAHLADLKEQGNLGPGVRAILLYPMNALANDQLKRLRVVLAETPWVTFGRYTGQTKHDPDDALEDFHSLHPDEVHLPNELLSRQEMRAQPPHLLVTNYAMLEYLLLRPEDLTLFNPDVDTWRFVVVDEAHVYDGAKGAEVAMLLRRLADRVRSTSLQTIATSATVGSSSSLADVATFATHLFNEPTQWIADDLDRQDIVQAARIEPPPGDWQLPSHISFADLAAAPAAPSEQALDEDLDGVQGDWGFDDPSAGEGPAGRTLDELFAEASPAGDSRPPAELLKTEMRVARLRRELQGGPVRVAELAPVVFPDSASPEGELTALVQLAASMLDDAGNPVLSARYHLWINSAVGGYLCLSPHGHHGYLDEHLRCPRCADDGRDNVPVWQYASCDACSTPYLRGAVQAQDPAWYAWGILGGVVDEDEEAGGAVHFEQLHVCPVCGGRADGEGPCPDCGATRIGLTLVPADMLEEEPVFVDARPRRCLACGKAGDIRSMGAGPDASTSVIASSLYHQIPAEAAAIPGEGRKLLAFSDSRQQAAYFAPYLHNSYQRMLWRQLIHRSITELFDLAQHPLTFGEVQARLVRVAAGSGIFPTLMGPLQRSTIAASWLLAEVIANDERQSLEGAGLVSIAQNWTGIAVPGALTDLGLTDSEVRQFICELLTTLRRQGAVTIPDGFDVTGAEDAFEFRGPVWSVKRNDSDHRAKVASWLPRANTNKRMDFTQRVLRDLESSADPVGLLTGLWVWLGRTQLLTRTGGASQGTQYRVNTARLWFAPADVRYRCDGCGRWMVQSVRSVCPTLGCTGRPVAARIPPQSIDEDHYRHQYRVTAPIPLKAMEHTAQWQTKQAAEVAQAFIEGKVNVLSCSTTFELGVDVGELQTVLMRNVPPTTANYVQRAGRAGRRGHAAALAVTYARHRPHDAAMFRDPVGVIAGEMRAPYVHIDNERIARRHVHSIALSAFFREMYDSEGVKWGTMASFCGPSALVSGPAKLRDFLIEIPAEVRESVLAVIPGGLHDELGLQGRAWADKLVTAVDDFAAEYLEERQLLKDAADAAHREGGLVDPFNRTIRTIDHRRLLDRLAVKNILPKYGFPVDVVELATFHLPDLGDKLDMQRDLTIALSEYAPGASVVAGGKSLLSAGIGVRPGRALQQYWVGTCRGPHQHFDLLPAEAERAAECPSCGSAMNYRRALRPEFGFVAARSTRRIGSAPPKTLWTGQAKVRRLSDAPETRRLDTPQGGIVLAWGKRAELAIVADGLGGRRWWTCQACGASQPVRAGNNPKPPAQHKNPITERTCNGTMRRLGLIHTFETDAIAIALPVLIGTVAESALAALVIGASDALEVPLSDLGSTVHPVGAAQHLVIFDTVPAGAGVSMKVGVRFEEVLAHALARVRECGCGEETSCYACLRHYGNQRVHEELSRKSAMSVLEPLAV